jgi:hypothetical protein
LDETKTQENFSTSIDSAADPSRGVRAVSGVIPLDVCCDQEHLRRARRRHVQRVRAGGQIVLAVSMLGITMIMGRFFCGFLCAFGSMGDFFWFVGSKLRLRRPKIGERADRLLKLLKYALLIGIVLLIWTFGVSILSGTQNPWTVFGMYASYKGWTDLSALWSVGAALLLLIIVGSMFIERFFCRYLCPLGAIFAIVSKLRLFKIRKPRTACGACRACTKRCSMGIPLYRYSVVTLRGMHRLHGLCDRLPAEQRFGESEARARGGGRRGRHERNAFCRQHCRQRGRAVGDDRRGRGAEQYGKRRFRAVHRRRIHRKRERLSRPDAGAGER